MPESSFDVVVLGAGSGGENVAQLVAGRGLKVAVVEEHRVGGECPFTACMPSKSMLHDVRAARGWHAAVERRREVTDGLDDATHADDLRESHVTLVRGRGRLDGPGVVVVGDRRLSADHVVLATGAEPVALPTPGLDEVDWWTSHAAWTAEDLPGSTVVVGAGAIGCEVATAFAGFGSRVTVIDREERPLSDEHPEVTDLLARALRDDGIDLRLGVGIEGVRPGGVGAVVSLSDGSEVEGERLVVAIGKRPRRHDLGLESLGLDPDELSVGRDGRVEGVDRVWAVGDVSGFPPYTHAANALAEVIADNLTGISGRPGESRELHVEHLPRCVFTTPPFAAAGPSPSGADPDDGPDLVEVVADYGDLARPVTDESGPGRAVLRVRRDDRRLHGFAGVGAAMDELVGQISLAIRLGATADDLARTVQPFPTHAEILRLLGSRAVDALDA